MMLVIKLMIYLVVMVAIKRTITKTHLQVAVAAVAAIAAAVAAIAAAAAAAKSNLWFSPKKLRFLNGTISAVKKQAW